MKAFLKRMPQNSHIKEKIEAELIKSNTKRTDTKRALLKFNVEDSFGYKLMSVGPPPEEEAPLLKIPKNKSDEPGLR
jgi:hypothetical protein